MDLIEFLESGLEFWEYNRPSLNNIKNQDRIQVRVVKSITTKKGSIYERSSWEQCSLWYEGAPFLVLFRREDFSLKTRFIVDGEVYKRALRYFHSLLVEEWTGESDDYVEILFIKKINAGLNDQAKIGVIEEFDEEEFLSSYRALA